MIFKSKPRPCEITRFAIRWQANFPCTPILLYAEFIALVLVRAVGCSRHDRAQLLCRNRIRRNRSALRLQPPAPTRPRHSRRRISLRRPAQLAARSP